MSFADPHLAHHVWVQLLEENQRIIILQNYGGRISVENVLEHLTKWPVGVSVVGELVHTWLKLESVTRE